MTKVYNTKHSGRVKDRGVKLEKKFDIIPIIDPISYYTTGQIIKLGLLPGISNTPSSRDYINGLLLYRTGGIRYPNEETTVTTIKSMNAGRIGDNRAIRKVQGAELIKFLQLNKILGVQ